MNSAASVWSYAYSGASDLLTQVTNPNASVTTYGYEGANSLKRLLSVNNTKSSAANISKFNYGYTDNGHKDARSFMERQSGTNGLQRVNFSYDNTDQLTNEQATETSAIANVPYVRNDYAYDRMGNRSNANSLNISNTTSVQQVHGVNNQNQLLAVASTPYTGATPGATTTTNYTYDAGGNLSTQATSGSNGATYSYDEADRLQSWTQTSSTGTNIHKSDWVYDGLSRKKTLKESSWNGTAWVLNSMKQYVYDGMDVVQERETIYAADGVTVSSTNQTNFTRVGNIGGILAKSTGTSTLTHTFFHYDGSGNVVSLTDSSQNSVAEYSYDSYGNMLTATGTQAASNPYRYSTKELHSWSGLYDYGFRFYSPSLGRWINRDPIEEDDDINLYAAFGNSPTNYVDSDGLSIFGQVVSTGGGLLLKGAAGLMFGLLISIVDDAQPTASDDTMVAQNKIGRRLNAIRKYALLMRRPARKKGPAFPNLKDHAARHGDGLCPNAYYNDALKNIRNGRRFMVRHDGTTKIAYLTRLGSNSFQFTATNKNGSLILTHMKYTNTDLRNKGIVLPKGF